MEGIDFGLVADASGDNEPAGGEGAKGSGGVDGKALESAFGIDVGVEEGSAVGLKSGNGLGRGDADLVAPAADGDAARFCINTSDKLIGSDGGGDGGGEFSIDAGFVKESGTEDDAARAGIEECLGLLRGADASADLDGETGGDLANESPVVAGAFGGVEVDELDEGVSGEALDPVIEVVEGEAEVFSAFELDDAAAHQID